METEISVRVEPYEVLDNMREMEQTELMSNVLSNMSPNFFSGVIEAQDEEAVITCFTAEQICDYADEQELVDELIRRGWKLTEDDEYNKDMY